MTGLAIFEVVVLAAFAANLLHRAAGERHQFLYRPAGRFGWALNALLAAVVVLVPLTLMHLVTGDVFLALLGLHLIAGCLFSVGHRRAIRRAAPATAVG